MATITEDYCSYEVAKLLNEKGFQVDTNKDYWKIGEDGTMYFMCSIGAYTSEQDNKYAFYRPASSYPCPTQSVAMKWLREVHKLHIAILWDCGAYIGKNSFCYHIDRMDNYEDKGYNKIGFDSSEEACEAAIKYCLEKLI